MADKKISELTALGEAPATNDLIPIADVSASSTKSMTVANLFTSPALTTPALGTPASGTMTNVTGLPEAGLTLADNTTNNSSTTKHGFLKKLDNTATNFMDGTGAWDSIKDSDLSTTDITTNDVSTSKHGFAPKAPNDTTKYLRGDATWATAGGLWTELADSTNATTQATFTVSVTTTGYAALKVYVINGGCSTANFLDVKLNNSGTGYSGSFHRDNGSALSRLAGATTKIYVAPGSTSANDVIAELYIDQPASANDKRVIVHGAEPVGGLSVFGAAEWANSSAVTSLDFIDDSGGNVLSGTRVVVLGLNT